MLKSDSKIVHLAKATDFENTTWINFKGKSIYEVMKYCYKSRYFTLSYSKSMTKEKLEKLGYRGNMTNKSVVDFLVEKKMIDKLKIDYSKVFKGNYIKGKLRIQTYLILAGYEGVG